MSKEIEQNMLRKRAQKLPEVTDEMWSQVDQEHQDLVSEFLDANSFRDKTKKTISFYAASVFLVGAYIIKQQEIIQNH